jgi:phospholipase/carboxylesterase
MSAERIVAVLHALERAFREMHPPRIAALRREVSVPLALLDAEPVNEPFREAAARTSEAGHLFADPAPPEQAIPRFFESLSAFSRAQATAYGLRRENDAIGRFFALPDWHTKLAALDPPTPDGVRVGVFDSAGARADGGRGFAFYVPERYTPERDWPLSVALHGGGGNGRDFLWTWLREARSRGFLLLAPSSHGSTWSFMGADVDAPRLESLLAWLGERWRIDRRRILLTGLSDGATYTICCGLQAGAPYTALAPAAGVLHPANASNGNLDRARGVPIYLIHGALDWMFPVVLARAAQSVLEKAGAALVYRELDDLSHAWPREENVQILDWFDGLRPPPHA